MTNRVENSKDLTAEQVKEIKTIVTQALGTIPPVTQQLNGCGRVYMSLGYYKMLKSHAVAKALDGLGPIRVTPRPREKGVTFYMGYDNATGIETTRAEHIAQMLKNAGYIAYIDHDGD